MVSVLDPHSDVLPIFGFLLCLCDASSWIKNPPVTFSFLRSIRHTGWSIILNVMILDIKLVVRFYELWAMSLLSSVDIFE